MTKVTPTSLVRYDDPEAADLADVGKLLGPARMVLDACAEDRPGHQAEAADMAQRIVDLIGHSVTDEPPHALVELNLLRQVVAALLDIYSTTGGTREGLRRVLSDREYPAEVIDAANEAYGSVG